MANDQEDWRSKARCFEKDPTTEIFFPPRDKTRYKDLAIQAKAMCLGPTGKNPCPVQAECLWYAVESETTHGIWGGMSHRERNAAVRKWQRLYKKEMTLKEYLFQLHKKEY